MILSRKKYPALDILKKKYKKVVYKRRISMPEKDAELWLAQKERCHKSTQISKEIDYFLDYYKKEW